MQNHCFCRKILCKSVKGVLCGGKYTMKGLLTLLVNHSPMSKCLWSGMTLVTLIFVVLSFGFSSYLDCIKISPFVEWYQTIINFWPDSITEMPKYRCHSIVAFFICLGFLLYNWLGYNNFYLFAFKSFAHDLGVVDTSELKELYKVIPVSIDITDEIQNHNMHKAIAAFDKECEKAIKLRDNLPAGFYGIAHTPFIFRLGYRFGDQSNFKLYHKARSNDSIFKEWSDQKGSFIIIPPIELNKNVVSDELIVEVSTTFEIKESEIADLKPANKHIVIFKGNILNFDAITSYVDAQNAREVILVTMRSLVKQYDIRKIHMVISSSAAFTFFLGMAYSKQHDPECIVYHYEMPHYPWGLSIKLPTETCFVDNAVDVQEN